MISQELNNALMLRERLVRDYQHHMSGHNAKSGARAGAVRRKIDALDSKINLLRSGSKNEAR